LWAGDCETDPFQHGRVPEPFVWGAWNGEEFHSWESAEDFLMFFMGKKCLVYFHNGGKFDFHFLLKLMGDGMKIRMINGRIVEIVYGSMILRDSYAIIPTALGAYQKDKIDYAKFEKEVRHEHMEEIIRYMKSDCVYLLELVQAFRDKAGKNLTIASTALSFCKRKIGTDPGKSDFNFDSKMRRFYFGGRVEAFKPGIHGQASVYDIKSAYPFAMNHVHPSGTYITQNKRSEGADFLTVQCFSNGAFPKRNREGLFFPIDKDIFNVTGWEFETAKRHGLISDIEIIDCVHFENRISFSGYVNHWFAEKQFAEDMGNKTNRHIAKIMLNSLYGKLAQNPLNYDDYKIVEPGTPEENGWHVDYVTENYEVQRKSTRENMDEIHGEDWKEKPLFLNVATAASITGFVRAMLLDAIHTTGRDKVAYCDTDSVIVLENDTRTLSIGRELGSWDLEGITPRIGIAGKKLYVTEKFIDGPKKGEFKLASKGVRLEAKDVWDLCNGKEITWNNDAPTFSLVREPKFVVRKIRATALVA
jgi:hypothetical protein